MLRPTCRAHILSRPVPSRPVLTRQISSLMTRWTNYPKRQICEIIRRDSPSHYVTQKLDAHSISWYIPTLIQHHKEKEEFWTSMCGIVGIPTVSVYIIMSGVSLLMRDPVIFGVACDYATWVVLPVNLGCVTKLFYHSARLKQLDSVWSEAEQELEDMRNRRKHPIDC